MRWRDETLWKVTFGEFGLDYVWVAAPTIEAAVEGARVMFAATDERFSVIEEEQHVIVCTPE